MNPHAASRIVTPKDERGNGLVVGALDEQHAELHRWKFDRRLRGCLRACRCVVLRVDAWCCVWTTWCVHVDAWCVRAWCGTHLGSTLRAAFPAAFPAALPAALPAPLPAARPAALLGGLEVARSHQGLLLGRPEEDPLVPVAFENGLPAGP